MGSDCYGILYYGFPLEEEQGDGTEFPEWAYDSDGDLDLDRWEDVYLKSIGYTDVEYEFDAKRWDKDEEYTNRIKGIWITRRKLLDEAGVNVMRSGYDGNFVHYVCTFSTSSEWGQMIPVSLEIQPLWEFQLRKFCEITGIPYKQPQWYLTSKWF